MIDRKVFNRQIAILAETYRHVLSGPTIDEYYLLLAPQMTTEQFVIMTRRNMRTAGGFWPKPGDLLPPVRERLSTQELDEAARLEGLPSPARLRVLPAGATAPRDAHSPESAGAVLRRMPGGAHRG